jgi:hypothetical protein
MVTIAIGGRYYEDWFTYAYPTWKTYCEKYGLGLFLLRDYTLKESGSGSQKPPYWEKFFLFDESEEFGLHKGLGLIPGRIVRIPDL